MTSPSIGFSTSMPSARKSEEVRNAIYPLARIRQKMAPIKNILRWRLEYADGARKISVLSFLSGGMDIVIGVVFFNKYFPRLCSVARTDYSSFLEHIHQARGARVPYRETALEKCC